jgi:hypothetical protein
VPASSPSTVDPRGEQGRSIALDVIRDLCEVAIAPLHRPSLRWEQNVGHLPEAVWALVPKPTCTGRKSVCFLKDRWDVRFGLDSAQPCWFVREIGSIHDPVAMQKVVGSSPIIRS